MVSLKHVSSLYKLSIEQIAYIFMQLLKMTHDLNEKFGLYFYLDLNPENVFLSIGGENFSDQHAPGEKCSTQVPNLTSDFQVTLGSLKRAFCIAKDTSRIEYLYP